MANAVIGALRVNLGLDSAQFQTGLQKSGASLNKFSKTAIAGFAAVTSAAVALASALAVGIRRTIDEADEMGKAAQKFGVAVDELSRLKHAADLSGVSMEGLGTGLRKLSQNMQQFASGAKNEASRAFETLRISVKNTDGTLKSSSQVMTEIAGKFANLKDGAEKTALAMAIFGRSGADLIPMLNAGKEGLRGMMEEADRLGIVISSKTAKAAEAFNDNLTRMQKAKDGLILKITAELLPALELMSEKFLKFVSNGEAVKTMADGVAKALHFIANEVAQLAILSARLSAEFAGLAEALERLTNLDFSGAWDAFQAGQEKSAQMAADLKRQIDNIFSGSAVSQSAIQSRIDAAFGTVGPGSSANAGPTVHRYGQETSENTERTADHLANQNAAFPGYFGKLNETLRNDVTGGITKWIQQVIYAQQLAAMSISEAVRTSFLGNDTSSSGRKSYTIGTGIYSLPGADIYAGKFAEGGTFIAPGNLTGDTTRLMMDVNGGERITVEKGGAGSITLNFYAAPGESEATMRQRARHAGEVISRELSRA